MEREFDFNLVIFSAAEAEAITGLSQATQRDWRRRGHLPAITGKAKYTVFDLCRMFVMAELSKQNISISQAAAIAELVLPTVAANVLFIKPSIEGLPEGFASPTIHREICERFGHAPREEKYLIIWSNDYFVSFEDDLAAAFAGRPKTLYGLESDFRPEFAELEFCKRIRDSRRHVNETLANATDEIRRVLLQTGRVSVFDLSLFGDPLIPNDSDFARNHRSYVVAVPKKNSPITGPKAGGGPS